MSEALDRSLAPEPGERRPFAMPEFERVRLTGGLELVLAPQPRLPLVHLEVLLPAGAAFEPRDRPGLATLTASLIDEGTHGRTSMEIAGTAERLGGWVGSAADWDAAEVAAGLHSRHLEAGLALVTEIVTSPTFPSEELERLRALRLSEHKRRAAQPAVQAADELAAALYGEGVYGRPLIGTEAGTHAISRDDVSGFYDRRVGAMGSALLVVGDFEPVALKRAVESTLGTWTADATQTRPPEAEPTQLEGVTVRIVDRPDAAQTEIRLGHAGVARSHPDFAVLQVLNSLLGGKFTSRINLNLRERHGFTYGAHSRFSSRKGPGPFVVSTAVANDVVGRATHEILHELTRIRTEPVGADELAETRSYLDGVFPYTLQGLDGVAARLRSLLLFDLPDDYFETYLGRIRTTSESDILEAARRHLSPDRLVVVASGPAEELRSQLDSLGPLEVISQPTAKS